MTLAFLLAWLVTLVMLRQVASMARSAFMGGKLLRAKALYRWAERLAMRADAKHRVRQCQIAIAIELGDLAWATQAIAATSEDVGATKAMSAVWSNNRAYLGLRRGDASPSLEAGARQAWQQFPHVDGFAHTYALACLQSGKLEESLAVLEALAPNEAEIALRAQRLWDLGRVWFAKGQATYASHYQAEARAMWSQTDGVPWYAQPVASAPSARQ